VKAARRIIPRDELFPFMRVEPHDPDDPLAVRCHATIEIDGTVYRCGRGHVDGIHDAFVQHHDGGAVRW
jgi:hypothetical protein